MHKPHAGEFLGKVPPIHELPLIVNDLIRVVDFWRHKQLNLNEHSLFAILYFKIIIMTFL